MEFLMTYGWAILVVLISLGALFYLGVFSPKVQNTCSIEAPFTCLDIRMTPVAGEQQIRIGAGGAISGAPTFGISTGTCTGAPTWDDGSFIANAENTINLANCGTLTKGQKFSGSIEIVYTRFGGFQHTATLQYSGTVEE